MDPTLRLITNVGFIIVSIGFLVFAVYAFINPATVSAFFNSRNSGRGQTPSQIRVVAIVFLLVAPLFVVVGVVGLVQELA